MGNHIDGCCFGQNEDIILIGSHIYHYSTWADLQAAIVDFIQTRFLSLAQNISFPYLFIKKG